MLLPCLDKTLAICVCVKVVFYVFTFCGIRMMPVYADKVLLAVCAKSMTMGRRSLTII